MTRVALIFFSIVVLTIESLSQKKTENIATFFQSVVFIKSPRIQTQQMDGIDYQIFLKNPVNSQMTPLISTDIGTGFLVSKDIDAFLITAHHVARTTNINSTIVFSADDQTPVEVKITDLIDPKYINGDRLLWTTHTSADVAVLPVLYKSGTFIPYEVLLNRLEAPLRQRDLIVYGYPLGLGVGRRTSPISKKYNPASGLIDLNRFDNNKPSTFFLIDDPSIGGLSGGPVVAFPQVVEYNDGTSINVSGNYVVGLVHGTINKDGGGYGAITPSNFIVETIDSAPNFSGKHIYRYMDGKIWSEVIYKDGFAWDVVSNFSHDGKAQEKGSLKDGNGTRYVYDKDGALLYISHHKNGRVIRNEKPDTDSAK